MSDTQTEKLPTLSEAKKHAKEIRAQLADQGEKIGHAQSLERVAHALGYRDWNTLFALLENPPAHEWVVGNRVTGQFLSQPFIGCIAAANPQANGWTDLILDLDDPVDVVTFDSFSNMRKRIRGVVGPKGHTTEKTSDGQPHLQIDL